MLPILSVGLAALLAAALATFQQSQPVSEQDVTNAISISQQTAQSGTPSPVAQINKGEKLVARAARQLLMLPGIEAKTRQRVNIFGERLVGSGTYSQMVRGPQLLMRLDLKLQVGEEVSSLQQISDGYFFWTRYDLPHRKSLVRVNLKRLRQAASDLPNPPPPSQWMAVGGLPKLLEMLLENFDFGPAKPMAIGKLPIWKIDGAWKPQVLASLLAAGRPDGAAEQDAPSVDAMPEHIPHGVTLILGRDNVIPLFPYSIAFYRTLPKLPNQVAPPRRQILTSLELFEVRLRSDLTPANFDYRPGNQEVQERTDEFIARLQGASSRQ